MVIDEWIFVIFFFGNCYGIWLKVMGELVELVVLVDVFGVVVCYGVF